MKNDWESIAAFILHHSSGQYNVYTHSSRERISIDSRHKELRIVMLRVFSRFRCRLANAKRTVGRYRVPISVQTTRRERSLFTASPSNFPDDKSLWNSSKARPIRRGRWHDGAKGTFRAFSERERTSWRGDSAASALVMTFTVDVCEAYCFHSQQASSQQLAVAPF